MLGWAVMKFKNFKTKIANKNYITHRPVYTTKDIILLTVLTPLFIYPYEVSKSTY